MILAKLKEATRDQHEALENVVDVMNKTFSIDDYKELITKFYRFYSAIEPKLPAAELNAAGFDIEPRRKTPLLERDLGTFRSSRKCAKRSAMVGHPDARYRRKSIWQHLCNGRCNARRTSDNAAVKGKSGHYAR